MAESHSPSNPWQNSRQTRTNTNDPDQDGKERSKHSYHHTPNSQQKPTTLSPVHPPAATPGTMTNLVCELSSSYLRGSYLVWSLLEILAATFSADCPKLEAVLATKKNPSWALRVDLTDPLSMSDAGIRALITDLSRLVRRLRNFLANDRWLLVSSQNKRIVTRLILEPVQSFNLNLDFVLKVFRRYIRRDECARPDSTILPFWASSPTHHGDIIASHSMLLRQLRTASKSEVRIILEEGIDAY